MNILVLDKDFRFPRAVRTVAEAAFEGLQVFSSPSPEHFGRDVMAQWEERRARLHGGSPGSGEKQKTVDNVLSAPQGLDPDILTDIPDKQEMTIMIRADSQELSEIVSPVEGGFLGYKLEKYRREPLFWKTLVAFRDRSRFNRAVSATKESSQDVFVLLDARQREFNTEIQFKRQSTKDDSGFAVEIFHISINAALVQVDGEDEKKPDAGGPNPTVDLIIASIETLGEPLAERVKAVAAQAMRFNESPKPVPIVFSAFDHSTVNAWDLIKCGVEDLIFKPIDDLLFLQKLMIVSPEKLEPINGGEFLFTLEETLPMELGQEYKVHASNEYGVKIYNRAPIPHQVKVKAVSPVFGANRKSGMMLSVAGSKSCEKGSFSTDLAYFGLTPQQFKAYKEAADRLRPAPARQVETVQVPRSMTKKGRAAVFHGETDTVKKDVAKRKIVLIDLDELTIDLVRATTENQFSDHELVTFDSFERALQDIDPTGAAAALAIKPGDFDPRPAFFPNAPLKLKFDSANLRFMGFDGFPVEKGVICGYEAGPLAEKSDFWREIFHPGDRPFVKDFLFYLASGQVAKRKFNIVNKAGSYHIVSVTGQLRTDGADPVLVVEMTDVTKIVLDAGTANAGGGEQRAFNDVDVVLLDYSFIKNDAVGGITRLKAALTAANTEQKAAILLTGKELALAGLQSIALKEVQDLLIKPPERLYLLNRLGMALPEKFNKRQPESFVFEPSWLDILKPVTLKSIGEYGLDLVYPQKVPVGAWGHFYHPELLDAQGRGLLGRCYGHQTLSANSYVNRFLFFGIRDVRLKQLRLFLKKSNLKP